MKHLDPATLRTLVNELDADRDAAVRGAAQLRHDPSRSEYIGRRIEALDDRAAYLKAIIRKLRNRATRAENARRA